MTATLHALGPGRDAGNYYTNDPNREARPNSRDEYYAHDGGGEWWSTGETIVRSGTAVDRDTFRDLCAGLDPATGDQPGRASGLVRGAGEKHRAGWDLTLSSPKTIGLLWAAGNEEQRALMRKAHSSAVEATLRFIIREDLLAVRLGAGGTARETPADILVAKFDHFTSREGDPELHTHCVLLNVAGSADGRYRTLEPRDLYRWTKTVGGYYRAHLAERLREYGLEAREAGRGQFEIAGIPQKVIGRFSKRSQQIEAIVEDRSAASGRQKELANLQSRQDKERVPIGEALEARWKAEFVAEGIDIWAVARDPQTRTIDASRDRQPIPDLYPKTPEIAGDMAVARAASALFEHESIVDRRKVLEGAYGLAPITRQSTGEIEAELGRLEADYSLRPLTSGETRDRVWTTSAIAEAEAAMLRAADRPNERDWITPEALSSAIETADVLSPEQAEALRVVAGRDGVNLLEAGAGTGKTTTARILVEAARRSGIDVVGLAPSWVASDELQTSTDVPSQAIAKWRHDEGLGRSAPWGARTLVLVDEAGMVGTRDMSAILSRARDAGAQVVLVGDRRQLEAVPGGGALRAVADRLERTATMDEVRRQKIDWQRSASNLMTRGDMAAGLQAYLQHGAVEFVSGQDATIKRAIEAWSTLQDRHGDDVGIITRRNVDATTLNSQARKVLKDKKVLKGVEVRLPSVDRRGKATEIDLAVGDRIRFGAGLPDLGVRNGTRGEITAIENRKDPVVRIELEDGRQLAERWSAYGRHDRGIAVPPRVTHGYAGTVHSVQGRTMSAAVLCVTSQTDRREVYVGMTRHVREVLVVAERDRLEAVATRRNALPSTDTQVRQAFLNEAGQVREKANVIDYVASPREFVASGRVTIQPKTPSRSLTDLLQSTLRMATAFVRDEGQALLAPIQLSDLSRGTIAARAPVEVVQAHLNVPQQSIARELGPDLFI